MGGVHLLATVRKYLASTLTKQGGRVSESVAWMDVEFQQKCFHPRGSFFYVYERTCGILKYTRDVFGPFFPITVIIPGIMYSPVVGTGEKQQQERLAVWPERIVWCRRPVERSMGVLSPRRITVGMKNVYYNNINNNCGEYFTFCY